MAQASKKNQANSAEPAGTLRERTEHAPALLENVQVNAVDATRICADRTSQLPATGFVCLNDWIDYAIELTGVWRTQLLSKSRCRHLTLPRAFITYHGRALGFTLSELAQRLERHPSSLLEVVERTLAAHPKLFTAKVSALINTRETAQLRRLLAQYTLRC